VTLLLGFSIFILLALKAVISTASPSLQSMGHAPSPEWLADKSVREFRASNSQHLSRAANVLVAQ